MNIVELISYLQKFPANYDVTYSPDIYDGGPIDLQEKDIRIVGNRIGEGPDDFSKSICIGRRSIGLHYIDKE